MVGKCTSLGKELCGGFCLCRVWFMLLVHGDIINSLNIQGCLPGFEWDLLSF